MEELKELVKIVSTRAHKKVPFLEWDPAKGISKDMMLFYGIKQGKYLTDDAAAQELYQTSSDLPGYKMTKMRLRKKLLNHLFFLDFATRSKIAHKHEQECLNLLHQSRMLVNVGAYKTCERMLSKLLKTSIEAEFTYITVSCLELLLLVYAQVSKPYFFYKNSELLSYYRGIAALEQEGEGLYNMARLELNRGIEARKEFMPKLATILDRLKAIREQAGSFASFDHYYKLNIFYYDMIGQPSQIIAITGESDQLFEKGKINPMRFDHRFNKFMNVHAYLRSKEYEKGLHFAGEYLKAFDESSNNWFAFMENYFLLALHAKNYGLALELIGKIDANPFFSKTGKLAKERWVLYRSYLYFVYPTEKLYTEFSYHTLISSVPEYSKDKKGFNVAILVLQYLYYLKKRDMDSLMHRLEAMRKYAGKHLKENFSHRAKSFFKLLIIPVKTDFDVSTCKKKGKYLYDRLQTIPAPGEAYAEIECIPYEQIWEIILALLEGKEEKVAQKRVMSVK